jgi:hypothetical protein
MGRVCNTLEREDSCRILIGNEDGKRLPGIATT